MADTNVVPTGSVLCPDGCCLEVEDPTLPRAPYRDRYARPMFEVLLLPSASPDGSITAMRITPDDYHPDRIFL